MPEAASIAPPRLLALGLEQHRPDLSVVVPAYNEEATLAALTERVVIALEGIGRSFEIIVVDDGSIDASAALLRRLHQAEPRLKVRILRRNHGKSAALDLGLRLARGTIIVMMDADLQDLPEQLPNLLAHLDGAELDFVQAWRKQRRDPGIKVWASAGFNGLCSAASGLVLHDVNCGFKVMRAAVADELQLSPGMHRFIPVLAARKGFRVGELAIEHAPRTFGRSRYGMGRIVRGLSDLLVVVLLPRVVGAIAPALAPAGLLSLLASFVLFAWMSLAASSRSGMTFEAGALAFASLGFALTCFTLAWLDRVSGSRLPPAAAITADIGEELG